MPRPWIHNLPHSSVCELYHVQAYTCKGKLDNRHLEVEASSDLPVRREPYPFGEELTHRLIGRRPLAQPAFWERSF